MKLVVMALLLNSAHALSLRDRIAGQTIRCWAPAGGGSEELVFNKDATVVFSTWIERSGAREKPERKIIKWKDDKPFSEGFQIILWEDGQLTQGSMTPCKVR